MSILPLSVPLLPESQKTTERRGLGLEGIGIVPTFYRKEKQLLFMITELSSHMFTCLSNSNALEQEIKTQSQR